MAKKRNLIVITGTPGSGKTTIAKELEKRGIGKIVPEDIIKKSYVGWDDELQVWIVDEEKFEKNLEEFLSKNENRIWILDSHLGHFAPKDRILLLVLCRADPKTIYKRLKERGETEYKAISNAYAELLEVIRKEIIEERGIEDFLEVWTDREPLDSIIDRILKEIQKKQNI